MTITITWHFGLKLRKNTARKISTSVYKQLKSLAKEFLDRKPADLSGGQRQRVAMGRAIVRDAKGILDGRTSEAWMPNCVYRCVAARKSRKSPSYRSYNDLCCSRPNRSDGALAQPCTSCLLPKAAGTGTIGRVEQILRKRVYKNPVNKFVAGFIGSPLLMNFINIEKLEGWTHRCSNGLNLKVQKVPWVLKKKYDGIESDL